jgi:hypothetical protein
MFAQSDDQPFGMPLSLNLRLSDLMFVVKLPMEAIMIRISTNGRPGGAQ